jgi:predicted nuclease of predicted toxin-antitoxin system
MTLLFDQHLSRKLVTRLADLFPTATHVVLVGLDRAEDEAIWRFATTHSCTIVTKDSDFNDISVLRGAPPKVIWLHIGNCTTARAEQVLRNNAAVIAAFIVDPGSRILEII